MARQTELRFTDFINESEGAEWGFFGSLSPILGDGSSERLSYGTSPNFQGDPMLYVPVGESSQVGAVLKSARRKIAKRGIECRKAPKSYYGYDCSQAQSPHKADIMHTGEAHVTVALGNNLRELFGGALSPEDKAAKLREAQLSDGRHLFEGNVGVPMPVSVSRPPKIVYGVAKFFSGQPLVALLEVECPMIEKVRGAIGLPRLSQGYTPHVTIGYAYGVDLGRLLTTDTSKGDAYGSTGRAHDRSYLQAMGVTEWLVESVT